MATLFDALQGGLTRSMGETGGRTAEAQKLLTTKATGRAVGQAGPARAAEGERIEDTVAAQEQAQARGGALEALEDLKQRSQALTQETEQAKAGEQEALTQVQQAAASRTSDLLESLRQEEGRLTLDQRGAALEQAAFGARLANDQYLYGLQDAGRRRRLDDANAFKLELQKQIFADRQSLLEDELSFKEMMALDEADFARLMSQLDVNAALQIASDAAKSANVAGIWSGVGGLANAAAKANWSFLDDKPAAPSSGPARPATDAPLATGKVDA
jgi:hypothetical protein